MGGWRCGYLRRSREGSDYTTINLYFVSHVFQSTLPRRERRGLADCCEPMDRFQSTLPRRERPGQQSFDPTIDTISIHAPAKGATAKITKTIPNDFCKINNYNNSFA